MTRAGRLAWRGLAVRARGRRAAGTIAMPDVFSIRHTTVEAYLEPIVHEVKVQRADLLADLRRARKREALPAARRRMLVRDQATASPSPTRSRPSAACWSPTPSTASTRRAARRRGGRRGCGFALWMALARATPVDGWRLDDAQGALGDVACAGADDGAPA